MAVKKIASIARFTGDTADTKPAGEPVGSTYFDRQTGLLYVNYDGTNYAIKLTQLAASTAAIGKLAANSGVDIGDVDVTSIAAGANTIGAIRDAGPSAAGTNTFTTSADMTTAADIGPAPTAGQYSVLHQAIVSVSAATKVTFQSETTPGAERFTVQFAARGTYTVIPRRPIKLPIADKNWQGITADVVTVDFHTNTTSEA